MTANNIYKKGAGLRDCVGMLDKDDKEYEEVMKELKSLYKKWTQRYACGSFRKNQIFYATEAP